LLLHKGMFPSSRAKNSENQREYHDLWDVIMEWTKRDVIMELTEQEVETLKMAI
jgi:hypothetical protein